MLEPSPSRRTLSGLMAAALATAPWANMARAAGGTGPAFDIAAYRGKVLYLDFWASWCGPCKLSFPFMAKLQAYYANRDFALVAVNVDHERAKADAFLSQAGTNIPIVYDTDGAIARRFGVKAMPTSVLIGPDARVRYVHTGFFPEQMPLYEAHITELLNGK